MTAVPPTCVCLCVCNTGNSLPKAQGSVTHAVHKTAQLHNQKKVPLSCYPKHIVKGRCFVANSRPPCSTGQHLSSCVLGAELFCWLWDAVSLLFHSLKEQARGAVPAWCPWHCPLCVTVTAGDAQPLVGVSAWIGLQGAPALTGGVRNGKLWDEAFQGHTFSGVHTDVKCKEQCHYRQNQRWKLWWMGCWLLHFRGAMCL